MKGLIDRFLQDEAASGIVLLLCAVIGLVLANSPLTGTFLAFWQIPVGVPFVHGGQPLVLPLLHWINDGLMAIFFFVVGLEVKREMVVGELRNLRAAALPLAAALGGMVVPAGIYLALQAGQPAAHGWGIPMATDIAFVVGCMALLGSRVDRRLRITVLSMAILDDIGAILVIALGYTESLNFIALMLGLGGLVLVYALGRLRVRSFPIYVVIGALIWLAFHESGVHATIAGVALGLLTPTDGEVGSTGQSPLEYLESRLHPWVSFGIMPLFALANAGVPLTMRHIANPIVPAVMAGLVIGKPVGIVFFAFLTVTLVTRGLPAGITWPTLVGAGCLGGIGFTMALFIAGLALEGDTLDAAKVGILLGSLIAALLGTIVLAAGESKGRRV